MLEYVAAALLAAALLRSLFWLKRAKRMREYEISMRPLVEIEVELMKRGGKFEGEPDYMQDFRVARSELDLEPRTSVVPPALVSAVLAIVLVVVLLL